MFKLRLSRYLLSHILVAALVALGLILLTEFMLKLMNDNYLQRQRQMVNSQSATVRAKIEGEFNSTLFLSAGLMAYVATNPKISAEEFKAIATEIVARGRNIRNIGLAKNNVITHLYPYAGNEAALGLDYTKLPAQWPAVKRAIDTRRAVVAGPVSLIQGGEGFIVRTPIFTKLGAVGILDQSSTEYWGLSSIVIDSQGFFESAKVNDSNTKIELALKGTDGQGLSGAMIFGEASLFSGDNIFTPITLPNGAWVLAARPANGWQKKIDYYWPIRLTGWLSAVLLASLLVALSMSRQLNRNLAFYDALTHLPNRRLFEDRLNQVQIYSRRYDSSFGIFYIDLDDFKPVNDKFGHDVGDGLLVEASKRMLASVRESDTVARVGGDEFMILVNDIRNDTDMNNIRQQLEANLIGSAVIAGRELHIGASIGHAVYPTDHTSTDKLQQIADERMYNDKAKNKSVE